MPGSGTSTLNVPAGSELVAEVEPYADAGFWVKRPVDGDGRLGGVLLYRVNPNNKTCLHPQSSISNGHKFT